MCVRAHGCEVREVPPSILSFGVKASLSGNAVKDSELKLPLEEIVGGKRTSSGVSLNVTSLCLTLLIYTWE